jgi:hypothetical protein
MDGEVHIQLWEESCNPIVSKMYGDWVGLFHYSMKFLRIDQYLTVYMIVQ